MLKMNSTSVNGSCQINGTDIVLFSASFSKGVAENVSISKNIINMPVYKANRNTCEADYLDFEVQAELIASKMESDMVDQDMVDTADEDQVVQNEDQTIPDEDQTVPEETGSGEEENE